jgi:ABC-type glycerol-3-phosphate transport system substrate-binding protein
MRRWEFAVFLSLVLAAAALFAAGCASGVDASEETDGKPVVIDFWRPG